MDNRVKIIGGRLRGSHIHFIEHATLRPTHARIRETLFNWLAPVVHGAHCLDLFAGSGALGFEAVSRGAAHVSLVEQSPAVVKALQQTSQRLKMDNVEIILADAYHAHTRLHYAPYSIVFLDPPYAYEEKEYMALLNYLTEYPLLASNAVIYLEYSQRKTIELPAQFEWYRHKQTQTLCYGLLQVKTNPIL